MHNDILDVEGCRVLARVRLGYIGIRLVRGVSVGKFAANGVVFLSSVRVFVGRTSTGRIF